ncbi:MAG: hypothetical protein IKS42_08585 [Oscillospiraceae bacterium]|nr:hypothetical protein [Oscillospiraceae bacterium]
MKIRKFGKGFAALLLSASLLCTAFPRFGGIRAAAADSITWDAFSDNSETPGMYCYTVSGNVSNPCAKSSYKKKSSIINELWFDFSVKTDNGTGSLRTYRADFSYNSRKKENNNRAVVERCFVRDNKGAFSFDIWLPGQLTNMAFHLNLDGKLSWVSYERLSFEVNRITCGGAVVNTNPSKGDVSSSTGSSNDHVGARMLPIDGESVMDMLSSAHVTQTEYQQMVEDGYFEEKQVRDTYGAVLQSETLKKLPALCDGVINQSFSHADQQSYYYYELELEVYNPINVSSAAADVLNTFYFDFRYKDNNGYGKQNTYRFDMSYANGRNRNDKYANLFRATNGNGYDVRIGVWVPGIVNQLYCLLNMDDGERLGVRVHSVKLGGFSINEDTDYVSSAYYDSKLTISCTAPAAQIDLSYMTEEETGSVLKQIRANQRVPLTDQYGALITDTLWNQANREIIDYFDTFTDRSTPLQLTRSPKYIARNAMNKSIYHAQISDSVQNYMAGRREAVQNAADIAKSMLQEQGDYTPLMALPNRWGYIPAPDAGKIILNGLPEDAVIYRKLTETENGKATYIHLKTADLEKYGLQKSGYVDEIYIDVPESCVIAGLRREPGTEQIGTATPKVINAETGELETEVYYKTDAAGNVILNKRGKPTTDNSKKPTEIRYQYKLTFPENGTEQTYQRSVPLPAGIAPVGTGTLQFRNLPEGTEGYMMLRHSDSAGRLHSYVTHLTMQDLASYAFPEADAAYYLRLPEGCSFAGTQNTNLSRSKTFGTAEDGDVFTWYGIEKGQLRETAAPADLTFGYSWSYAGGTDSGQTHVYTAAASLRSAEKKDGRFVTAYQAAPYTQLWCGYALRLLSMDAEQPPLILLSADGKYSDQSGETAGSTKLYLFYPDTYQYTAFDENGTPLGFRHIESAEYAALGVDSKRYAGYVIGMDTLQKTASGKTITVIAVDK